MAKVLLLDDEMTMVQMVSELLRSEAHQVTPFTNGSAAAERLGAISPELVVVNLGTERTRAQAWNLLQKARNLNPPALVILIIASASIETALEAMKRGAYDYVSRPFTLDELKLRVRRALAFQAALSENVTLRKQLQPECHAQQFITQSPTMQSVLNVIEHVADSDYPLLIQGQSGTGKHLLARVIHSKSRRRFAPLIPFCCSAVPENYLEPELFGQRKASGHSSLEDKPGLFKEAEGGTILLDDIVSLPLALQDRFLEVLLHSHIRTPGDGAPISVDVRVLAGSDQPLEPKVASGSFRGELYRGLNSVEVLLPTLSERPEDIPLLISHFLAGKIHPRSGKPCEMTREALDLCRAYRWPGNVRELENCLQHACMLCQDGAIHASDLPRNVQQITPRLVQDCVAESLHSHLNPGPCCDQCQTLADEDRVDVRGSDRSARSDLVPLKQFLRDQEVGYLQRTLSQVGGSKEKAAEVLGISLATIYRKLSEPNGTSNLA